MADKAVLKARKAVVKAAKKIADLHPKLDPASDKKFPALVLKLGDASTALETALDVLEEVVVETDAA